MVRGVRPGAASSPVAQRRQRGCDTAPSADMTQFATSSGKCHALASISTDRRTLLRLSRVLVSSGGSVTTSEHPLAGWDPALAERLRDIDPALLGRRLRAARVAA